MGETEAPVVPARDSPRGYGRHQNHGSRAIGRVLQKPLNHCPSHRMTHDDGTRFETGEHLTQILNIVVESKRDQFSPARTVSMASETRRNRVETMRGEVGKKVPHPAP